ncbi:MAG: hypothetical protein II984_11490 [Clostridia bacterium]|nr:hypothetical protein [Clostridia bacterium]
MKIYFCDGGSTFYDNSRVGYNSFSIEYQLEPYTDGRYCTVCEIDDSFTEKEALLIAQYAASDAVNKGQALWTAVKEEAELLMKSKNKNDK